MVVVGDDDVDPALAAAATSALLVVPQSTVTMSGAPVATARSMAASERPWPSSRRIGTYGDLDAEPAKRGRGSRGRSGRRRRSRRRPAPVRCATRARSMRSRRRSASAGARVVEAAARGPNARRSAGRRRRGRRGAGDPPDRPSRGRSQASSPEGGRIAGKTQRIARLEHALRMPRPLHRGLRVRPHGASGGRPRGVRAAGRPGPCAGPPTPARRPGSARR